MLFQARCSYINEHLLKIWNISNFFFQNKKLFENFPPTIFSLFKIVLFLIKKIYFHEPEHSRDFRWKILIKWRCPDRHFVDIIFRKNDPKKKFFLLTTKLMWSFLITIILHKNEKKNEIWKKLIFQSMCLFKRTTFIYFSFKNQKKYSINSI